jgi:hypothetical protein
MKELELISELVKSKHNRIEASMKTALAYYDKLSHLDGEASPGTRTALRNRVIKYLALTETLLRNYQLTCDMIVRELEDIKDQIPS